jgi:hypothetical protein
LTPSLGVGKGLIGYHKRLPWVLIGDVWYSPFWIHLKKPSSLVPPPPAAFLSGWCRRTFLRSEDQHGPHQYNHRYSRATRMWSSVALYRKFPRPRTA